MLSLSPEYINAMDLHNGRLEINEERVKAIVDALRAEAIATAEAGKMQDLKNLATGNTAELSELAKNAIGKFREEVERTTAATLQGAGALDAYGHYLSRMDRDGDPFAADERCREIELIISAWDEYIDRITNMRVGSMFDDINNGADKLPPLDKLLPLDKIPLDKLLPLDKFLDDSKHFIEQLRDLEKATEETAKKIAKIDFDINIAKAFGNEKSVQELTAERIIANDDLIRIQEDSLVKIEELNGRIRATFSEFAHVDVNSEFNTAQFRQNLNNQITQLDNYVARQLTELDNLSAQTLASIDNRYNRYHTELDNEIARTEDQNEQRHLEILRRDSQREYEIERENADRAFQVQRQSIEQTNALRRQGHEQTLRNFDEYTNAMKAATDSEKAALREIQRIKEENAGFLTQLKSEYADYLNSIAWGYERIYSGIENAINNQIKVLEEQKKALQDRNDEEKRGLDLLKAEIDLLNSRKKMVYVYSRGIGFHRVQDTGAIDEAQKRLDELKTQEEIRLIDAEIERLRNYISDITGTKDEYENRKAIQYALESLGLKDEKELLDIPLDTIKKLADSYLEILQKQDTHDWNDINQWTKVDIKELMYGLTDKLIPMDDWWESTKHSFAKIADGFDAMSEIQQRMNTGINPATYTNSTVNNTHGNIEQNVTINGSNLDTPQVEKIVGGILRDVFVMFNNGT